MQADIFAVLAGLGVLAVTSGALAQSSDRAYTLVELLPVAGATECRSYAINNSGMVVGSSTGASEIATMWAPDGFGTGLGVLPGASGSRGIDINDNGEVLFRSSESPTGWYVRSPKSVFTQLPVPGGYQSVSAGAINSYGEVVGTANNGNDVALVWRPTPGGPVVELFPSAGSGFVSGSAINDSGLAAYAIFTGFGNTTIVNRKTGAHDTSNTGAQIAWVEDINNADRALVVSDPEGDVLETYVTGLASILPFGCVESGKYCQDFGDGDVEGFAINEACEVVGQSVTVEFDGDGFPIGDNGINEAFVWSLETGTRKLADLIVEGDTTGWFLERAVDINDSGWIAGNGTKNGEPRAFLLIPREPCVADTNRDGDVTPADFSAWVGAFNRGCD